MMAYNSILGKKRARDASHHIVMLDDQRQSQRTPYSIETITNDDCATPTSPAKNSRKQKLTNEQIEAKHVRDRARHANLTPEQRQARRYRQNVQNALRRNTLSQEHIETRHER